MPKSATRKADLRHAQTEVQTAPIVGRCLGPRGARPSKERLGNGLGTSALSESMQLPSYLLSLTPSFSFSWGWRERNDRNRFMKRFMVPGGRGGGYRRALERRPKSWPVWQLFHPLNKACSASSFSFSSSSPFRSGRGPRLHDLVKDYPSGVGEDTLREVRHHPGA